MGHVELPSGPPFVPFLEYTVSDIDARTPADLSEWLESLLIGKKPFIIRGFSRDRRWDQTVLCTRTLLESSVVKGPISVRNCATGRDRNMNMKTMLSGGEKDVPRKGLYAKDLKFPEEWTHLLSLILPVQLQWQGTFDLFKTLTPAQRPEVLMAYLGTDESVSGFHRCMSATVALNLVVDSANDGPATLCFGTDGESQNAYDTFMESLGQSPHTDWYNAPIAQLRMAQFPIYVTTQQKGDLVVFPAATAHQVTNLASVVTKAVWNMLHSTSMLPFMKHVQPAYQRWCHPDTGRVHLVVLSSLLQLSKRHDRDPSFDEAEMCGLFKHLLDEEESSEGYALTAKKADVAEDTVIECNFCGLAIWNRHLHCQECADFDLCMYCYASGRSCKHLSSYHWVEKHDRETCFELLDRMQSKLGIQATPSLPRRTMADLAQEALQARSKQGERLCHLCRDTHPVWSSITCAQCSAVFCYRGLFRHFDIEPRTLQASPCSWTCPKCEQICNCRCCHFSNPYRREEKPARTRVRALDPRGRIYGFTDNVFDHKRVKDPESSPAIKRPLETGIPSFDQRKRMSIQSVGSLYMPTKLPGLADVTKGVLPGQYEFGNMSAQPQFYNDGNLHHNMEPQVFATSEPTVRGALRAGTPIKTAPSVVETGSISTRTMPSPGLEGPRSITSQHPAAAAATPISNGRTPDRTLPRSPTSSTRYSLPAITAPIENDRRAIMDTETEIEKLKAYGDSLLELNLITSHAKVVERIQELTRQVAEEKRARSLALIGEMQRDFPELAEIASLEARQLGLQ